MRLLFGVVLLFVLGCGGTQPDTPPRVAQPVASLPTPPPPSTAAASVPRDEPLPEPPANGDWPGFLGPRNNSVSTEKGIIAPWPEQGLRVVWYARTGAGYSMPSISKGLLYLFDRHGGQARLTCMDCRTGKEFWKFEYPTDYQDKYGYSNGPRTAPVISDGHVYFFGPEGMLYCLDAETGKEVWKHDTAAKYGVQQNFFGVGSSPVVLDDLLIVPVGGSPSGNVPFDKLKGNGSGVVAFDKKTGAVRWSSSDELASYSSPVLGYIDGQRWCFVFARGGLLGLDPAKGTVRFRYPWRARILESVNAANPVVVGNKVFITECYGPGSSLLEIKDGKAMLVWTDADKGRDKSMQAHWCTPIHHDGYLYASSSRHSPQADLRCIELATGKVMWSQPKLSWCTLLMVDGHFICLSEVGKLRLLKVNPEKYDEVSVMHLNRSLTLANGDEVTLLGDRCWAAPILSNGLLYVRGDERLVCLELIAPK